MAIITQLPHTYATCNNCGRWPCSDGLQDDDSYIYALRYSLPADDSNAYDYTALATYTHLEQLPVYLARTRPMGCMGVLAIAH